MQSKPYTLEEATQLAASEFGRGNGPVALNIYNQILGRAPDFAEGWYNRGIVLQSLRNFREALASYDKAIALKPGYAEAYINRGGMLQELGQHADALANFDKAITLKADNAKAHYNRGLVLQALKQHDAALASYDMAITLNPSYAEAHNNRGAALKELKRLDEALKSYNTAIKLNPGYAEAYDNLGLALVNKGDMQEAEGMFRKALELKPGFANALFNLTRIRRHGNAADTEAESIQALLAAPGTSAGDKENLYFSLGKIYDDSGRFDEAFAAYRQGNEVRKTGVAYNAAEVSKATAQLMQVFSKEFLSARATFASASQKPLFIVGMPRSGTTLMASIISNHQRAATAGELPTITELAAQLPQLTGKPYPQVVVHLTPNIAEKLIRTYLQRLGRDAKPEAIRIVDKHPLNFWHLGFIAMLFPDAHIIHCTRDPLDTCLSNYFQRFGPEYDYSFDLQSIGHYYTEYARLMAHWQRVLPVKMISVRYEDMILHTERATRTMLEFLGLEWDERCLSPHTNPAAIETASSWQVRQPIYNQSVERWRHYEKHLAPLKNLLQHAGLLPA